jgi:hypothetical protein
VVARDVPLPRRRPVVNGDVSRPRATASTFAMRTTTIWAVAAFGLRTDGRPMGELAVCKMGEAVSRRRRYGDP